MPSPRLNRYQVPFRYKILSYSGVYTRADAAVLFFAARYYQIIARLLPRIRPRRDRICVRDALLTRPLHDGIGLAEDPGNGESFGMHRTRPWPSHLGRVRARHANRGGADAGAGHPVRAQRTLARAAASPRLQRRHYEAAA